MDFTFGIITAGACQQIATIVESIRKQKIPNYEIIIVGGTAFIEDDDVIHIPFDESVKHGWITRKKNIICERAKYENVVLLHDYFEFSPGWYEGFCKFGNNFQFAVNCIKNRNGRRFRDFCIFPYGITPHFQHRCLLPYDFLPTDHIRKILYISGGYYVIKKSVALKFPLDERLCHSMGEDVYYCRILSQNGIFIECNPFSEVRIIKNKSQTDWEYELNASEIHLLESMEPELLEKISNQQMDHVINYVAHNFKIQLEPKVCV
jgi:hypothetical protein